MPSKEYTDKKRLLSRRSLAVKVTIAQVSWLSAPISCENGAITWLHEGKRIRPNSELFAETRRKLHRIRQDKEAAARVVGDVDAWIEQRLRSLDEAKLLVALKLEPVEKKHHQQQLSTLLTWLVAQSVAVDSQYCVAPTIAGLGQQACPSLVSLVEDDALPEPARMAAALVLGAIHRSSPKVEMLPLKTLTPGIVRAYGFGVNSKFELDYIELVVRLLACKGGEELAKRARSALQSCKHFKLPMRTLQLLLARDVSAIKVVELISNCAQIQYIHTLIRQMNVDSGAAHQHLFEAERKRLSILFSQLLVEYSTAATDAEAPLLLAQITAHLIEIMSALRIKRTERKEIEEIIHNTMKLAQEASSKLQGDCLRLINCKLPETYKLEHLRKETNKKALKNAMMGKFSHELAHIPKLLNETEDASLLQRAEDCSVLGPLSHRAVDADTIRLSITLNQSLKLTRCRDILSLVDIARAARNSPRARAEVMQLLAVAKVQPGSLPLAIFEDIIQATKDWPGATVRDGIAIAARTAAYIGDRCNKDHSPLRESIWIAIRASLALKHWGEVAHRECTDVVLTKMLPIKKFSYAHQYTSSAIIASYLCGGSPETLRNLYNAGGKHFTTTDEPWNALIGLKDLPVVRDHLRRAFLHHAGALVPFLNEVRLAAKVSIPIAAALESLERAAPQSPCGCRCCKTMGEFSLAIQDHWTRYVMATQALGQDHEFPSEIQKLIELPTQLARELSFLESQNPVATRSPLIAKRIAKLQACQQQPTKLRGDADATVLKHIEKLSALKYVEACRVLLRNAITNKYSLDQFSALGLNDELAFDLLVMRYSIDKNRTELSRMLRACLKGDIDWPLRQPANRKFLAQMKDRNMDTDVWTSAFPAYFNAPQVKGGPLKISIELNPIEVLKMGVYFDTCLSFDGINAFSSIANATDLNKRVIYVRDRKDKPIARKLIAIDTEWNLLGYSQYCSCSDTEACNVVGVAVREYAKAFAAACRIPLSDDGVVASLVSESWYDDGAESWEPRFTPSAVAQAQLPAPQLCYGENAHKKKGRR